MQKKQATTPLPQSWIELRPRMLALAFDQHRIILLELPYKPASGSVSFTNTFPLDAADHSREYRRYLSGSSLWAPSLFHSSRGTKPSFGRFTAAPGQVRERPGVELDTSTGVDASEAGVLVTPGVYSVASAQNAACLAIHMVEARRCLRTGSHPFPPCRALPLESMGTAGWMRRSQHRPGAVDPPSMTLCESPPSTTARRSALRQRLHKRRNLVQRSGACRRVDQRAH